MNPTSSTLPPSATNASTGPPPTGAAAAAAAGVGGDAAAATTAVATSAPSTGMEVVQVADNANSDAASAAGVPAPTAGGKGPAAGGSGSSTQEGGGEVEKRALESAWSLYLQVTITGAFCVSPMRSLTGWAVEGWLVVFCDEPPVLPASVQRL